MNILIKKTLMLILVGFTLISLSACQNTQLASKEASSVTGDTTTADSIADAQSSADAAKGRAQEAFQAAQTARRVAERGVEMANQNQAALRALNDKIDRMFETISRK